MMKPSIIISVALAAGALFACKNNNVWSLEGSIDNAADTTVLVQACDNGRWYTIDTIHTNSSGAFDYSHAASAYPDIYRLYFGGKSLYFPIDSIDKLSITADAAHFDTGYKIAGSNAADMFMNVENRIAESLGAKGAASLPGDSLLKRDLAGMILASPADIVAYYIINKQVNGVRLFNPSVSADNRIIGAVANAFNELRPTDPRTRFLRALYLAYRPSSKSAPADTIQASQIGYFDTELTDNVGKSHKLSDVVKSNKVVLLDFTAYTGEWSAAYNVLLAKTHQKYHGQGFEIYQIAFDDDEFQWKQTAKNLPWVTVYNPSTKGNDLLMKYNVTQLPAAFLIVNGEVVKRFDNVDAIDGSVAAHL